MENNNNNDIESLNGAAGNNPSNGEIEENNLLSQIDAMVIEILKLYLENKDSEEIESHFK